MQGDLTVQEAAQYIGVTRKVVEGFVRDNGIRPPKWTSYIDESGRRRIPLSQLENYGQGTLSQMSYNPHDYDPKFDVPKAEIWGNGKAPVVEPSTTSHWETVVFVSDIHVPYHDPVLVDGAIELIGRLQPDRVVINGDTNDFFGLSRFNKEHAREDLLQGEIDDGIRIRRAIREVAPNAQIDETLGNHEERLITYRQFNAAGLGSLNVLRPREMLGLDELEIKHWPQSGFRLREDFIVEHGVALASQAGATARKRLEATLVSGIMGHSHRMGEYRRSGYRDLVWYEQGCLCMLNPDYIKGEANWKQGFAVGTFSTQTSNFNVQLIPAVGRGFIFDGHHYGDTESEADIWSGANPEFDKVFDHGFRPAMARA